MLPAYFRGKSMSVIVVQTPVDGVYFSTLLKMFDPLSPPIAYSSPYKTPTPAPLRRTFMLAIGNHKLVVGL